MGWMIFSIIVLICCVLAVGYTNIKLRKLRQYILPTKSNSLLREILKLSLYKYDNISNAAIKIIESLKNYYTISDCTLLKMEDNYLKILASNIAPEYHESIEGETNRILNHLKHYKAEITTSETYLPYPSARQRRIKYNFFIPLVIEKDLIGAILIEDTQSQDLDIEKEFFSIVIENITIVLQNLLYYETINNLAMLDGLTGIYNRNYMNNFLSDALSKKIAFSLAIFDIDFFKKFNDTHGHLFGDLTLKTVSHFVRSQLAGQGTLFRFGGEEFIIYLKNQTEIQASQTIEEIRKGIERLIIQDDRGSASVTCSFGLYEVKDYSLSFSEVIKKADIALYYSKENGRNQTTRYSEMEPGK
ncbi:hypothetical protein A7D23_13185 [Dehalobacter sp. TeCB1]|nr:hypothetical protein A7D23_13185 [Dehalobacter sp. TeCB1]